jgi:hypothetical protein
MFFLKIALLSNLLFSINGFSLNNCLQNNQNKITNFIIKSQDNSKDELLYKSVPSSGEKGMKGFYRRPSKAIEQGGGFFIPGLEGERVRILSALALFVALLSNRIGVANVSTNVIISEVVAYISTLILLLQGIADFFVPENVIEVPQNLLSIKQSSSSDKAIAYKIEVISKAIIQVS